MAQLGRWYNMSLKLAPSADGLTIELQDGAGNALLSFDSSGVAEFPEAENVYTKTTAGALASLALAAGGIMETGSNADGEYLKFANGWMICFYLIDLGTRIDNGTGTDADPYRSSNPNWLFPQEFIEAPIVVGSAIIDSGTASLRQSCVAMNGVTPTEVNGVQAGALSSTSTSVDVSANLIAIGRWKA